MRCLHRLERLDYGCDTQTVQTRNCTLLRVDPPLLRRLTLQPYAGGTAAVADGPDETGVRKTTLLAVASVTGSKPPPRGCFPSGHAANAETTELTATLAKSKLSWETTSYPTSPPAGPAGPAGP